MTPTRSLGPLIPLVFLGCAGVAPPANDASNGDEGPSLAAWRIARARLHAVRDATGHPRTERVAVTLREPRSGRVLDARGAAAIDPRRGALRMILLGPGGSTALDIWIDGDRYRFAVPPIALVRRGGPAASPELQRGLPIAFLRSWLLQPAGGALLTALREPGVARFVLRDGDAIVDLALHDGGGVSARRTTWSRRPPDAARKVEEETIVAEGFGCAVARYHQASTGLDVTIRCEGEDAAPPDPRAFEDPDANGGGGGS